MHDDDRQDGGRQREQREAPRPQRQPGGTLVKDDTPRHPGPIKPTDPSGNTSQRTPGTLQASRKGLVAAAFGAALESARHRAAGIVQARETLECSMPGMTTSAGRVVSLLPVAAALDGGSRSGRRAAGFLCRQADHLHCRRRRGRRIRPAGAHGGAPSRQAYSAAIRPSWSRTCRPPAASPPPISCSAPRRRTARRSR